MSFKKNILVVLTEDYMEIGGLKIPAINYIGFLKKTYEINEVLMKYHVYGIKNKESYKTKLLSKIDENTHAIVVFSGINQAFTTIKLINDKIPKKCKKIFYMADSPYLFMKSYLELAKDDINNFRDQTKYSMKKYIYKYKEAYCLKKFDEVIYLSKVDLKFVKKTYKNIKANLSAISHAAVAQPNLVLKNDINKNYENNFRIGFLTSISEHSYIESIKPLIYEIMPSIIKEYPNTELLIVGKNISLDRAFELQSLNYVNNIEFVENLSDFYNNVDILVSPIRKKNGILNKVLEAWGYGKCVVGYNYNFDAFTEAQEGIHYLSGKDNNEVSKKILEIISGNNDISKIGIAAHLLVKENYNWDKQENKFMKIVN